MDNLTNKKFGRLTAIRPAYKDEEGELMDTIKTVFWYLVAVAAILAIPYCLMDGAVQTQAEREGRKVETIKVGQSTRVNGILVLKVDGGKPWIITKAI